MIRGLFSNAASKTNAPDMVRTIEELFIRFFESFVDLLWLHLEM